MKSGQILKDALKRSSSIRWLLPGILCLEFYPIASYIWLTAAQKTLPTLLSIIFQIVLFIASMLFFGIYFVKRESTGETTVTPDTGAAATNTRRPVLPRIISTFSAYWLLAIMGWLSWFAGSSLYPFLYAKAAANSALVLPVLLISILAICVMLLFVLAAFIAFATVCRKQVSPAGLIPYLFRIIKRIFLRLPAALVILLSMVGGVAIFRLMQNHVVFWLDFLFADALASRFVYIMLVCAIETVLLQFCVNIAVLMVESMPVRQKSASALAIVRTHYIPAAVLLAALLLLGLFFRPVGNNPVKAYEEQLASRTVRGDILLQDPGRLDLASRQFRQAYAMSKSMEGYLNILLWQEDPDASEYSQAASACFQAAYANDSASPYYYLFAGYMNEANGNTGEAIRLYKVARALAPDLADADIGILRVGKTQNDARLTKETIDLMISANATQGLFTKINGYSKSKLKDILAAFEENSNSLFERQSIAVLEKFKVNDVAGMFQDITTLAQTRPDSPTLLLLQGLAALAYRPETANYALAESSFEQLSKMLPDLPEFKEYEGRVLLFSKQYEKAAGLFEKLYDKYPDNLVLAEQYAYALLAGNKNQEALEVCNTALKTDEKDWFCLYVKAMAQLKLSAYADSLDSVAKFIEASDKADRPRSLDTFLHAYCLAYAPATANPDAAAALGTIKGKGYLADYILGVTAWRDKDYPTALACLDAVLKENEKLGYAWYTKGSVLFEKLRTGNSATNEDVEACFLKSSELVPESLEVWFSLGNLYKTWSGRERDALRAYRRVVDLEPSSDHSHDYYGVVIHASGEIANLQQYDD